MPKKWNLRIWISPPLAKGGHASIEIPPDIADEILKGKNKQRIILTFNNGASFHRALQRFKNGESLITIGKTLLREAKKEFGLEENITLAIDRSEFGMDFPEEMQEVLKQDPEGNALFRSLNPGRIRNILFYISSAKTSETRIKRSFDMLERIKFGDLNPKN